MYRSPLFIRTHSKELLRGSLHNDTLFLVRLKVIDYSLLVGIDEDKHELVVGIVGSYPLGIVNLFRLSVNSFLTDRLESSQL